MTGAGTSWSIDSRTVQRPSPESATQPLRCSVSRPLARNARPASSSSRAHDRALHPQLRDAPEIEVVVARVHDLEALARLHQAVLDAVVDHLHVVPGAGAADGR